MQALSSIRHNDLLLISGAEREKLYKRIVHENNNLSNERWEKIKPMIEMTRVDYPRNSD